jgi:diguanylate cyclase (GGDEF)-like protein/PAS domain S-box-containing protein
MVQGRSEHATTIRRQPMISSKLSLMSSDESIYRSLVEHSVDTIFRMTPACEILYVSPAVRRQLGYEPEELVGKIVFDLIYEPDRPNAHAAAAKSAEEGVDNSPGTQRWVHKEGHLIWIEVNGRMVRDEQGRPHEIIIVTRDITDRKAQQKQLELLATTDALTGLRNRRGFDEILDREWRRTLRTGSPTSLLLLDLDHFKLLNDAYGHAVGDDCLRAVAQAFRRTVRREIDQVFRYGGEELAAILPHTNLDGAIKVAECVCGAIAALRIPHRENGPGGGIMTASLGVATAMARDGGTTQMPAALLQAADTALYKAKQLGRNRVEAGTPITPIG